MKFDGRTVHETKKSVLIYPGVLGNSSEVWIYNHLKTLVKYAGHVLVVDHVNKGLYPYDSIHYLDSTTKNLHWLYQFTYFFRTLKLPNTLNVRAGRLGDIISRESIDLLHAHFLWNARELTSLCKGNSIPIVVTAHGSDVNLARVNLDYRDTLVPMFARVDKVIAVSAFIANKLLEIGCPEEKITKIYLGTPVPELVPYVSKGEDTINVVSTGSLIKVKGHKYLIAAFSRAAANDPRLFLTLIGDGEERGILERQISASGLSERIRITGYIPHFEVNNILSQADIYAQHSIPASVETPGRGPSFKEEALGVSLVEASAFKVPIVATRTGGVPEICRHGENGFLVEPHDVEGMAVRIRELADNHILREKMGRRGRLLVEEEFDAKKQIAKIEALYDQLLNFQH